MRYLSAILALCAALAISSASAGDSLGQAKAEIAGHKLFSAVPLLQAVINAPDASQVQVEEAAVLQSVLCAGLVIGAGLTMRGLAADATDTPFKALVAGQMMTSRAGFAEAAGSYLNATVMGAKLDKLQLKLPELSTESVTQMEAALTDPKKISAMLANYGANPAEAQGLLAAANHYGLYGVASDIGLVARGTAPEGVRSKISGGVGLSQLYYLDWLATAALKFHHLVKDPTGPDMLSLAKRCDERLKKVAGADAGNKYVKQAQARAKEYK
jgi:hypothetical protein